MCKRFIILNYPKMAQMSHQHEIMMLIFKTYITYNFSPFRIFVRLKLFLFRRYPAINKSLNLCNFSVPLATYGCSIGCYTFPLYLATSSLGGRVLSTLYNTICSSSVGQNLTYCTFKHRGNKFLLETTEGDK